MKTELILKIDQNIAESMRQYAVKNKKNMSKKIFVDLDIILDILCQREPYYGNAV